MPSQDLSGYPADFILDVLSGGVLVVDRRATITHLNAAAVTSTMSRCVWLSPRRRRVE